MFDNSIIPRIVVQQSGFFQVFTWDNQKSEWKRYWSEPTNQCDNYGTCGSNGNCDSLNFEDFRCTCLPGFEPKFPHDWYENRDGSGGCVRKPGVSLCGNGEGFAKVEGLKIPDTSVAIPTRGLSLEECEKECLRNCSCPAYSVLEVRNGGSGCLAWHGNLIDIQKLSDQGQDLFVRVDVVELALVLRCIQIGLLCVQENAINRPSMLEVVFMLGNETTLPPPKKPAFLFNENQDLPESSTSGGGSSINEVTTTIISAR
uniref:non-specific serine/threonine protein kinase n=1 Tax=Glycine max TaxID=3847 RepID=A0A0R0IPR8_SOYBN